MIDTHTHLYLPEFAAAGDSGAVAVRRALAAGVSHMILPNVGTDTIAPMRQLHSQCPAVTSMAMGLHPTEVDDGWADRLARVTEELERGSYVAVGEVGIDLYWSADYRDAQMQVFDAQLREAARRSLPVIIHCRSGLDETLEVIAGLQGKVPELIFHSFTGSPGDVERIRRVCDAWFGINGVVTFRNAGALRDAVADIGLRRLLTETDSPYLAPVPHRGRRNESAYMVHVRDMMASLLGTTPEIVDDATTANARQLFRIGTVN